jgi:hypothetical protein
MNNKSITRRHFIASAGLAGIASVAPNLAFAGNEGNNHTDIPEKETGLTFLFQGDSITDGGKTPIRTTERH